MYERVLAYCRRLLATFTLEDKHSDLTLWIHMHMISGVDRVKARTIDDLIGVEGRGFKGAYEFL